MLVNPNNAGTEPMIRDLPEATRAKGLQLAILKARTQGEIDTAFTSLDQLHAGALVVAPVRGGSTLSLTLSCYEWRRESGHSTVAGIPTTVTSVAYHQH